MSRYAIDASAWVEYLEGSKEGLKVKEIVEGDKNSIFTNSVTFAEVVSKFIRKGEDEKIAINAMSLLSKIVTVDRDSAEETGRIHANIKKKDKTFGLAGAFIISMAESLKLKIVTKDSHFKHFRNVVFL